MEVPRENWLPRWLSGKESTCQCRRFGFDPWIRTIPWRRKWQPTPVFLMENPMDRGAWLAIVHGVSGHGLVTRQQVRIINNNKTYNKVRKLCVF